MRIEQHIVAAWAEQLADKLTQDVIDALQKMDSAEMLSGDSGLKNVWEEVCVQVQGEQSFFWDTYVETMESLLAGYAEGLTPAARMALWAVTDQGWDYIADHHADDQGAMRVPVDMDGIVGMLKEKLLAAAADFSNQRVERFLARHEDGYDELDDEEEDEDGEDSDDEGTSVDDGSESVGEATATGESTGGSQGRFFDLRPGLADPVVFVITRQQIEAEDAEISLEFLRSLVPTDNPQRIWSHKGRLSLVISGYDADPRELFEIPEVRRYLRSIDEHWPFWLFFLNQVDESIKVVAACLASTVEVAPGMAHIDPAGLQRFMERAFTAVNFIFETCGFPESENEALSRGVEQLFSNSLVDPSRDGYE